MPPELGGAYVQCFTVAEDCARAIEKSLARLRANGLEIREVLDSAFTFDASEWTVLVEDSWPDQAAGLHTQQEFESIMADGGVVFGPFGGYNPRGEAPGTSTDRLASSS